VFTGVGVTGGVGVVGCSGAGGVGAGVTEFSVPPPPPQAVIATAMNRPANLNEARYVISILPLV
jgi:hypothetical protein